MKWICRSGTGLVLSLLLQPLSALSAEFDPRPPASSLSARGEQTQDPDQLYSLALAALAANQPYLARDILERVVAARPLFAGAWLDLALATYRSGDPATAVEHLEYLQTQFSLPPTLAAQVDYWYKTWQAPAHAVPASPVAPATHWQGELQTGWGHDSNANAGLASSEIILTTPSGNALFNVDSAYLPRADQFGLIALSLQGPAQSWGVGRLSPIVMLRAKQPSREHEFATFDIQAGLVYQRPIGQAILQANASVQNYRLGGQTLFNGLRLVAQRLQPWRTCQGSVEVEYEYRHHLRVASQGGQSANLSAGLTCPMSRHQTAGIVLKTGFEKANADRPGGNNQSQELQLSYEHQFSHDMALQASWRHSWLRDQDGYSPLLQDNAVRSLQRSTLMLALRHTLSSKSEIRLSYEQFRQQANLALFEQHGSLLTASFVYFFR